MANLLVVEDDADWAYLVRRGMASVGHDVECHATAMAGLAALNERTFDGVVTDLRLPDGDGATVCNAAHDLGLPVVVITSYANSLDLDHVHDCAQAVLSKPFPMTELVDLVAAM